MQTNETSFPPLQSEYVFYGYISSIFTHNENSTIDYFFS